MSSSRISLFILATVFVALASCDYIEDYHRSVELECKNHLASLAEVAYFHNRCKIYDTKIRLEKSPLHKGYGLMANRGLKRGELVMSETPTIVFETETYESLEPEEFEKTITEEILLRLPEPEYAEFLTLADAFEPDNPSIYRIIQSNMFNLDEELAVFLKISRINHSCRPNCYYHFFDGVLSVFAARDVKPGEELTISYIDDFQPKKDRQKYLLDNYGFTCNCELCSRNTSDEQEAAKEAARSKLGDMFTYNSTKRAPEDNIRYYEHMLELAKLVGLDDDALVMGEINMGLLQNLIKIPDYPKRYNYNPNHLAKYAFGNLTVPFGEQSVLVEYPILLNKFSFVLS